MKPVLLTGLALLGLTTVAAPAARACDYCHHKSCHARRVVDCHYYVRDVRCEPDVVVVHRYRPRVVVVEECPPRVVHVRRYRVVREEDRIVERDYRDRDRDYDDRGRDSR